MHRNQNHDFNFDLNLFYFLGILRHKLNIGDNNIHPTIIINRKVEVMYYPWDESKNVYVKMTKKWNSYKKFLMRIGRVFLDSEFIMDPKQVEYRSVLSSDEQTARKLRLHWRTLEVVKVSSESKPSP